MKGHGPLPPILADSRRKLMAWLLANGLAQAALMSGIALATRQGFDGLHHSPVAPQWIMANAMAVALFGLMLMWLRVIERATAEKIGQSYLMATRLLLFDQVNNLPSRVLQKRTQGVMMVRFVADLNALNDWVGRGLAGLLVSAITITAAITVLAWLSPLIAACVAIVIAIALALLAVAGTPLYKRVRKLRSERGRLAANLGERLGASSPVRVFGRARGERARLKKQSKRLADAAVSQIHLASLLRALPDAISPILTALVLATSMLQAERIDWGTLLASVLIVNLLDSPIRDLSRVFVFLQNFRAARDVLGRFLQLPSMDSGQPLPPLSAGPGQLVLKDVSVDGVFKQINAQAQAGNLIAITGASGTGKSTLLALATRMFDPAQGTVCLDGQNLSEHDLNSIRQAVGTISPGLPLLRGSIRRNLTYRARSATEAEIDQTLQLCGLTQAIDALPRGLATRIAEHATDIPAATRQRLIIARAIMGAPRLLLIDDADALLDTVRTETLAPVLQNNSATVLLVTSDPRWLAAADAIWHMDVTGLHIYKNNTTECCKK